MLEELRASCILELLIPSSQRVAPAWLCMALRSLYPVLLANGTKKNVSKAGGVINRRKEL